MNEGLSTGSLESVEAEIMSTETFDKQNALRLGALYFAFNMQLFSQVQKQVDSCGQDIYLQISRGNFTGLKALLSAVGNGLLRTCDAGLGLKLTQIVKLIPDSGMPTEENEKKATNK